jgi:hypothetical protein
VKEEKLLVNAGKLKLAPFIVVGHFKESIGYFNELSLHILIRPFSNITAKKDFQLKEMYFIKMVTQNTGYYREDYCNRSYD